MLSDDLQALAEEFSRLGEGGASIELAPEAIAAIIGALNAMSARAWHLENAQVSVPARQQGGPALAVIQGGLS